LALLSVRLSWTAHVRTGASQTDVSSRVPSRHKQCRCIIQGSKHATYVAPVPPTPKMRSGWPATRSPQGVGWRTGWDSNPRYSVTRTHTFQACALDHSATCPQLVKKSFAALSVLFHRNNDKSSLEAVLRSDLKLLYSQYNQKKDTYQDSPRSQ
jgi:hypothetical protein